jgi:integrase
MRMGLAESNPTTERTARSRRRRTDDELSRIWRACKNDDGGRITRLLILSGCRRAEVGDMCWSELDDPERPSTFTIPARRAKNGRAHTLPVMPMMRDIITSMPRMATRDQLFGQRSHGFTRWAGAKAELDRRSSVENWLVHDVKADRCDAHGRSRRTAARHRMRP